MKRAGSLCHAESVGSKKSRRDDHAAAYTVAGLVSAATDAAGAPSVEFAAITPVLNGASASSKVTLRGSVAGVTLTSGSEFPAV